MHTPTYISTSIQKPPKLVFFSLAIGFAPAELDLAGDSLMPLLDESMSLAALGRGYRGCPVPWFDEASGLVTTKVHHQGFCFLILKLE